MKKYSTLITKRVCGFSFLIFSLYLLGMMIPLKSHAQWNLNTSVNLPISSLEVADMETASTTDGKTWIAFYVNNSGNYDMRAQLIDANGYKLLGADGMLVSNKTSGSATFVFNVCVDASNNLIIGCQDMRAGSTMKAVVYKVSQAGTHLWGADGIVLGDGMVPYPALLSNGEVAVVWNEESSNTLNIQKITTSGTLAWTTPISVLVGTSSTSRGQLVGNTAGKFTMVFQKMGVGIYSTLYSQMFTNAGTAVYSPVQICDQTTSAARYYSIIAEADTTYFGYYCSQGFRFNSFLQRINPDGVTPWGMNGSNFNVYTSSSDNYQMETVINKTAGSSYVWAVCSFCDPNQTIYGVYIQKFNRITGARQFTDAGKVVYPISASVDRQCGDLALVNDQPMFMSEDVNGKIYATRLDGSGNFVWPGNRVELSSTTATPSIPKMRQGFTPDGPDRCAGIWTENRGTYYMGYAQGISVGGLIGVDVTTQNGVPAVINTPGGTLQMVATVYPAAANQNVTWSIVPVTGGASITPSGLVTGIADGTVYAKAVTVQDVTVKDSLLITLSNQVPVAPTVVTNPATAVLGTTATLNGTVTANGSSTTVTFEWGLTASYGNTIAATPSTVTVNVPTPVYANLTGLAPVTTYHFRCVGVNGIGTTYGADLTFTTCQPPDPAGTITGLTTVCQGQTGVTYSTSVIPYATSYVWTLPPGASIVSGNGTNNITVNYATSATSGNVTVAGTNSCTTGTSSTLAVTVNPIPLPTITGPTNPCLGTGNSIYSTQDGMTNYTWTVSPGGTLVSGSGTDSIEVQWNITGSQSVGVNYTNASGCQALAPTVLSVLVSQIPDTAGTITGDTMVCAGTSGLVYSVSPISGATSYLWNIPPGTTITAGSGTNAITLDYSDVATSGTVSVMGTSSCGNGVGSELYVTVNPIPETPVIDSSDFVLTSSAPEGNQWYKDGTEIPGATGQQYTVTEEGCYLTVVTLNGCSSEESNEICIVFSGMKETGKTRCELYPVPNEGRFTVSFHSTSSEPFTLEIFNSLGVKMFRVNGQGGKGIGKQEVEMNDVSSGVYYLVLTGENYRIFKKFLVIHQ